MLSITANYEKFPLETVMSDFYSELAWYPTDVLPEGATDFISLPSCDKYRYLLWTNNSVMSDEERMKSFLKMEAILEGKRAFVYVVIDVKIFGVVFTEECIIQLDTVYLPKEFEKQDLFIYPDVPGSNLKEVNFSLWEAIEPYVIVLGEGELTELLDEITGVREVIPNG